MIKPKLLLDYVKKYQNEIQKLLPNVSEESRILLPDHLVSNQEIDVYITSETGVLIDYVGLNSRSRITTHITDLCFDDLVFPPSEHRIPCSQGSLSLKPLAETTSDQPITTISFLGDLSGIVLFKIKGDGHMFAYEKRLMEQNFGRYIIFNIYLQREHSDGSLVSRYVRYAELYPDKKELFTPLKAVANARKDLKDFLSMVTSPDFGPPVQKYVRIGDVVHQLKKNSVVVLGKDTPLLRRIRDELRILEYNSFLVKEQQDLPEQSPEEKVKLYTLMSKFAVMEDSFASGHIAEFEYCKTNRVVLAILRQKGKGSTWMIGDAPLVDVNYIKSYEYEQKNLHEVLVEASQWAESFIEKKADVYKKYFS
jgi:hypothetical protein